MPRFLETARALRVAAVPALLLAVLAPAAAEARLAVGPNVRMAAPALPGRGIDAVSLAVNPRNARHVVAVHADWASGQCEHRVSFDGGRRWAGEPFQAPEGFGDFPCNVGPHLAEHMQSGGVAFGSGRNVYATFAASVPKPDGTEEGKTLLVSASRDGGRTWGRAQVVSAGGPTSRQGPNHVLPTIAVDRARVGGPAQDRVYVSAAASERRGETSTENVVVVTSTDAGATFGPAVPVNTADQNAIEQSQPVIARDGTVYVAWRERGRGEKPGTFTPQGFVVVSRSSDQGRTWTQTRTASVTGYSYGGPAQFPFTAGQSFTASTFPRLGIDPRNDTLYLVYGQGPVASARRAGGNAQAADHFIDPDQDVWFQRSLDGAATWSAPRTLNTAPLHQVEITQTRHPWVSVSRKGRVDVVWQDRRHWYRGCVHTHVACDEARLGDTYYAYSRNGGRTFSRNHRISDRSTNNDVGFDYRFGTYWAYAPAIAYQGADRLLVGWMESRRGNVENDNQDIYLARVTHGVRGRRPVRRIGAGGASAFSVAMSRRAYPGGPEAVLAGTFVTRPWTRLVVVNRRDVGGALAGGVLARANIGSVLAVPATGLTAAAKAEVARLAPVGAYVVGDEGDLSAQVLSDLAAAGVPADQIVRLDGTDDADTARLVAGAADRRTQAQKDAGEKAYDAAIVVDPDSPHAVTAAVLAANRRLPVLFTDRAALPAATRQALAELAIDRTLVIGGPAVIDDAVLAELPAPQRLAGSDVFATSRAVLTQQRVRGVPDNIVYVTDGRDRMRTALLGASVARIGGLQLVARRGAPDAQLVVQRSKRLRASVTRLVAVGG